MSSDFLSMIFQWNVSISKNFSLIENIYQLRGLSHNCNWNLAHNKDKRNFYIFWTRSHRKKEKEFRIFNFQLLCMDDFFTDGNRGEFLSMIELDFSGFPSELARVLRGQEVEGRGGRLNYFSSQLYVYNFDRFIVTEPMITDLLR